MAAPVLSDDTTIATMFIQFLRKKFLKRHEATLVYDEWGKQEPIPMGQSRTIVWHQFTNLSEGYTVGEGSAPNASAFSTRKTSATLVEKADLRSYSNVVKDSSNLPVVTELISALGYSGAKTKDTYIAEAIGFGSAMSTGVTAAASAFYPSVWSQGFPLFYGDDDSYVFPAAGGGAIGGFDDAEVGLLSTTPVIAHLRKAATHLENMNAQKFEDNYWRGIIHPTVSAQIRSDSLWPTWNAYANLKGALQKGLLGVIEGIMFKESTQAFKKTLAASAWSNIGQISAGGTLYGTLIYGKEAYGVTKLAGKDVTITHIPPGKVDKTDPLGQLGVAGYLFPIAAKVLNPSAGVILGWYKSN